ncbi:MAG: hypothetical protein J0M04_17905 [Verrucomicrobia bacterium]|nr:hypothetical protein [Verrucomicrobiota bacterium]
MKQKLVWLAFVAGSGIGFGVGAFSHNTPPSVATPPPVQAAGSRQAAAAALPGHSSFADLSKQLARLSVARRKASATAIVDRMGLGELRKLVLENQNTGYYNGDYVPNDAESLLQAAAYEKWAETDPEDLIAFGLSQTNTRRYAALNAAFAALARLDPEAALARMSRLDPDNREIVRDRLICSIAENDPQRGFELAMAETGSDSRNLPAQALAQWIKSDSEAALDAFAALPKGRIRAQCLESIVSAMASRNSDAALAWAGSLTAADERQKARAGVMGILSYQNPEKAMDMLLKDASLGKSDDPFYSGGVTEVISNLARLDYEKAKKAALSLTNPTQRVAALSALAGDTRKNHAEDLLALAATLPAAEAKALYLGNSWWESDATSLAKWAEGVPDGPLRQQIKGRLTAELAWEDPEEAAKQFGEVKPGMMPYTNMAQSIARGWANIDSDKALAWASGLENFGQRKEAVTVAFGRMADADPADAASKLANLTDPEIRSEAAAAIATRWASQDPEKALAWAKSLTGDQQSAALRQIAQAQVRSSPDQAREVVGLLVSKLTPDDWKKSEYRQLVGNMAGEFAETDPAAAAKFAATLPAGEAQNTAYSQVIGNWARYAPDEAENWLGQIEAGDVRDHAAGSFAESVASYDPGKAYDWAVAIDDPIQRRKAAENALSAWKNQGGTEQARQALQDAGVFTEQEIKELGKTLD